MLKHKLHYAIITKPELLKKVSECEFASYINYKPIIIDNKNTYNEFTLNEHHWTTKYIWDNFIPLLVNDLELNFNKDDFIEINNYDAENKFNLTYHNYKDDYNVTLIFLATNIKMTVPLSALRLNKHDSGFGTTFKEFTDYHRLYRGAHEVTLVNNEHALNNRFLILNCDSMMIPVIPILIPYFKSILVLDNRYNISHSKIIMSFLTEATDYIGCLYHENILTYKNRYKRNLQ